MRDLYSRYGILSTCLTVQSWKKVRILFSTIFYWISIPYFTIMLISWLNRLSLIDYPGYIGCVVFTLGCNLRCWYCHNPDFVLPERIRQLRLWKNTEEEFFGFLTKRRGILEWVSICGGEPTIHNDLPDFCRRIKDLGYRVKLDTNGSRPKVIQYLIEGWYVDYIAMDIKHTWEQYHMITGKAEDMDPYRESVEILKNSTLSYEFRTTLIGGIHSSGDISSIGEVIRGASRYYLQKYRSGDTLDPRFFGYPPTWSMLREWKEWLKTYDIKIISIRE